MMVVSFGGSGEIGEGVLFAVGMTSDKAEYRKAKKESCFFHVVVYFIGCKNKIFNR